MIRNSKVHAMLAVGNDALEDELEAINSGGCGFVAVEMHLALKAYGINSSIVLLNNCYSANGVKCFIEEYGDCINSAYMNIFNDLDENVDPDLDPQNGHLGILFDGSTYDYKGMWGGAETAISEHIEVDVMEVFLLNKPSWNCTFRRANRHIEVRRVLQEFFAGVCNKHLTWELTI